MEKKSGSQLKKWDNDIYKYDVTEASKLMNPWLKNYGQDRFTHSAEKTYTSAAYYQRNEGRHSHGYPFTAWM